MYQKVPEGDLKQTLLMIQQQLFDLGADLSQPVTPDDAKLRVTPVCVTWLERQIDAINEPLADLTSFVLPGGAPAAAGLPRLHDDLPQLLVDLHPDVPLRPGSGELSERVF